jgi:hypothetical protein
MSNSLGKTKTDDWSHCGEKRESETSYHGRMLRMKRKGYLIFTMLAEMHHAKITKMAEDRDETDPHNEVTFGRRRPDSVVIDWTSKILFVLIFKRTSDQRRDYRERGESRARAQHDIHIRSLEKVAGEAEGENGGWKIKLIIFVGGTSGSVNVQIFNNNLKELQVLESKRNARSERFGL